MLTRASLTNFTSTVVKTETEEKRTVRKEKTLLSNHIRPEVDAKKKKRKRQREDYRSKISPTGRKEKESTQCLRDAQDFAAQRLRIKGEDVWTVNSMNTIGLQSIWLIERERRWTMFFKNWTCLRCPSLGKANRRSMIAPIEPVPRPADPVRPVVRVRKKSDLSKSRSFTDEYATYWSSCDSSSCSSDHSELVPTTTSDLRDSSKNSLDHLSEYWICWWTGSIKGNVSLLIPIRSFLFECSYITSSWNWCEQSRQTNATLKLSPKSFVEVRLC